MKGQRHVLQPLAPLAPFPREAQLQVAPKLRQRVSQHRLVGVALGYELVEGVGIAERPGGAGPGSAGVGAALAPRGAGACIRAAIA